MTVLKEKTICYIQCLKKHKPLRLEFDRIRSNLPHFGPGMLSETKSMQTMRESI